MAQTQEDRKTGSSDTFHVEGDQWAESGVKAGSRILKHHHVLSATHVELSPPAVLPDRPQPLPDMGHRWTAVTVRIPISRCGIHLHSLLALRLLVNYMISLNLFPHL